MAAQNIWHNILYALTLSNINRFTQLFHCQNQKEICNNRSLKIQPHLKCVATRYTTLWNVMSIVWNNTF